MGLVKKRKGLRVLILLVYSCKENIGEAGEIPWSVRGLLCNHEDPNFIPTQM